MSKEAGNPRKHIKDLAFMGFVEVVKHLPTILGNFKFAKQDIQDFEPDALILLDYPGFNLRMAEWASKKGIKVIYYISPQIWAWKTSRVHKIKKFVDLMLVILPFEKDFYEKYGMDVTFVGHPLMEVFSQYNFSTLPLTKPFIALLPGSRVQEIERQLPVMLEATSGLDAYDVVIAQAPNIESSFYTRFLDNHPHAHLIPGRTYDIVKEAKAALVTSGTATLETALIGTPELVLYKGSYLSYQIAKRLIKVKYISLVNLIMDEAVIPELIQDDVNPSTVRTQLLEILQGPKRNAMLEKFDLLRSKLKGTNTSTRAAEEIVTFMGTTES